MHHIRLQSRKRRTHTDDGNLLSGGRNCLLNERGLLRGGGKEAESIECDREPGTGRSAGGAVR